jgi:hypothetical protein
VAGKDLLGRCELLSQPVKKSAARLERRFGMLLLDAGCGESVEEGGVAFGVWVEMTGRSL